MDGRGAGRELVPPSKEMKHVGGNGVDFSVWNPTSLQYDYYQAPAGLRDGVIAPTPILSNRRLGLTPEEAARSLPSAAVQEGSGSMARGMIAGRHGTESPLGSLFGLDPGTMRMLFWIGGGYLAYRWWMKR